MLSICAASLLLAQSGAGSCDCGDFLNTDFQGGPDLAHGKHHTLARCGDACLANPECYVAAWNGLPNQDCYLKGNGTHALYSPGTTSCVCRGPLPAPTPAPPPSPAPPTPPPTHHACVGNLSMTVEGAPKTVGVMQTDGNSDTGKTDGTEFTLHHGGLKVHLTETCADHFTPDNFLYLKMLGKSLAYTVDLSNAGCGCNAAVYLTSMPGWHNASSITTKSDLYCDANSEPYCPEIDLMEANAHVSAATLHKCDFPYWDEPRCDGGGYGRSTRDGPTGVADFGPGGAKVDTARPFRASHRFVTDGKNLTAIETSFVQAGGKGTVWLNHTDAGYMASMDFAVKNPMVLTISLWGGAGGTMGWLDSPPCDATIACDPSAHATWQDFEIG